jgi:hypothetical protein
MQIRLYDITAAILLPCVYIFMHWVLITLCSMNDDFIRNRQLTLLGNQMIECSIINSNKCVFNINKNPGSDIGCWHELFGHECIVFNF